MKFSYDPRHNIAYFSLREGNINVSKTITVSDEIAVDLDAEGKILGLELLNANQQLEENTLRQIVIANEALGQSQAFPLS